MPHVELPQAEFKVVMLGDTNVGKTSLVLRFAEGYYRDNSRSPTLGAFFITKRVQSASTGVTCKVQIWDTAGQTKFQKMAPMYYTNAAAVVICYDVSNLYSFERAKEWTNEVLENAKANNRNIVFAIVATKSDLIYQAQIQAQCEAQQQQSMDMNIDVNNNSNYLSPTKLNFVPTKQGMELAQSINGIFMDTSARNDENVDLLFQKVAEQVLFVREQQRIHGMNYNYWSSSPTTTAASVGNENAVGNLNAAGTGVSSVGTVGGINVGTSSNGTSTTPTTTISTNSNSIKNGGGGDYSYKNGNGGNTHYPTTPTKIGRRVRNSLHNDPNGNSMNMNSNNTPTIYDNDHEDDENYDYDNSRGNDLFNSGTIPINQNDRDPNGNKENYNSNHHGRKEQHQQQNQGGGRVGINSFDLTNQKNQQSASSTTTSAVGLCYGCSSNDGSESSSCMIQ